MAMNENDAKDRFGSADFATTSELKGAGLITGKGLHHGFTTEKKPQQITFQADTPILVIGAAGSRKLTSDIAYKTLAPENTVFLDPKGEIAAISNINPFAEHYYFNPYELHSDAPWFIPANHRFNILEFADPNSVSFFEDMLTMAMNLISKPAGGGTSTHFWGKATQVSTAILVDGRENNPHFSLPDFYNVVGDIQSGGGEYFDFHINRMKSSRFTAVRLTAIELEAKAQMGQGEFGSIMSTISNNVQCLGSPALQVALSAPSTISFKDFLQSDKVRKLFIMMPAHLLETNACVVRGLITALTIEQQRNPIGRLHICLDEAGQMQGFEALPRLFSYGRGSKCRVSAYYQNPTQGIAALGKENFDTLVSNSQSKIITSVSSYESAKFAVDNILGKSTYQYLPQSKQTEAAFKRAQAVQQLLNGGDFVSHLLEITKQNETMQTPDAVARPLMTPDEVMRMNPDEGILDINNLGIKPYIYKKWPYFLNSAVAHKFLPNPFHPPFNKIFIPARFGRMKAVNIISEKAPASVSHLPQYSSGYWSYPENFCPIKTKRFGLF